MSSKSDLQNWLLLAALTLIWGTSYILIKKSLVVFSPIQATSIRISVSFLLCLPFLRSAVRDIPRAKYPHTLMVGVLGTGLPSILFNLSMTHVNSSVTAIINSLSPLFTVLTGFLIWQVSTTRIKLMGVLIGLAGAVVLVFGKHGMSIQGDMIYVIMPIVATLCYGTNSNFVKQHFPATNALHVTVLSIVAIGLPAIGLLLWSDVIGTVQSEPGAYQALGYVVILAVFGTFIGWLLFYKLVQRRDALFAASVTYLIPIVAIAWGLADGEGLALYQLAGLGLILAGVYFVSRNKIPFISND
jgi:drug/metabolite transporter (DMT)-like permease